MDIFLNGKARPCASGDTPLSVIHEHHLKPEEVVVEINGKIISRGQFGQTAFKPGDRVEILHFVGGG